MSSFDYDVNPTNALAAILIYNSKIVIDPIYSAYDPNTGSLSNGDSLLNVTFNIEITNPFEIAYLRDIINLIFNDQPITKARDVDSATFSPTNQHDYYLGFGQGSEWVNISTNNEYTCYSAAFDAAVWQINDSTYVSLAMSIPNSTAISLPATQNTLLSSWSTSPDPSLYDDIGGYSAGTFSFSQLGRYRFSIIFPIEELINLQLGSQFEIQWVRNGTDIIRRIRLSDQLGTVTLLTSTFVLSGTFNFKHNNISDTYTIIFSNGSLSSFSYNVSSYSLYNLSIEFLG